MTRETFGQIITLIEQTYSLTFTHQRQGVWWELLKDLPDDPARAATVRMCKTSPYPPKPADLYTALFGTPAEAEQVLDEEAELALRHVAEWICDYRINDWQHPVLHAFVRALGGIDAIVAMMGTELWSMRWRDHKTLYKAIRRRGVNLTSPEAAPLTPQAVSAGFTEFGLEKYAARGLPVPVEVHPFAPSALPALPAKGAA